MPLLAALHQPIDVPLALLAGTFTVASPCVLPVLPIVLSSSVEGGRHRSRPLSMVAGFVLTFAAFGMLLGAASAALHLAQAALRNSALVLLAVTGILRLSPRLYDWMTARLRWIFSLRAYLPLPRRAGHRSTSRAERVIHADDRGDLGRGFLLGMSLGAVWTPCAGPVLASILVLVVKAQDPAWSALLLLCYAIGAGIPMLAVIYGGRYATDRIRLLARHAERLQQVFGALVLLSALAIYFQYDVFIYARIAAFLPPLAGI